MIAAAVAAFAKFRKTNTHMRFAPPRLTISLIAAFAFAAPLTGAEPPWQPVRDFGGATLLNERELENWTMRRLDQNGMSTRGQAVVAFEIGTTGRVTNCLVEKASGDPHLDGVLCPVLEKRARFSPSRSADGTSVAVKGRLSIQLWPADD
jgi:TonB family protein